MGITLSIGLPDSTLTTLPPTRQAAISGPAFFAGLVSRPFFYGLTIMFTFALAMCLIAAAASWLRGAGGYWCGPGSRGPDKESKEVMDASLQAVRLT